MNPLSTQSGPSGEPPARPGATRAHRGRRGPRGRLLAGAVAVAVAGAIAAVIAVATASQHHARATAFSTVTVCTFPAITCTGYGGADNMKTKPGQIVTTADGSDYLTAITWTGWGNATATGTGTLEVDNCTPNCATGTHTGYPATITLSGLSSYGSRAEAYAEMIITAPRAPSGAYTYRHGLVP